MAKFKFRTQKQGKDNEMTSQGEKDVDATFIQAVKNRNYGIALNMIDNVGDINVVDPETHATALHFAAARNALPLLRELEKRDDLNYLARDREGRYPSELAWHLANNEELGAQLQIREKNYALKHGVKVWPKPS